MKNKSKSVLKVGNERCKTSRRWISLRLNRKVCLQKHFSLAITFDSIGGLLLLWTRNRNQDMYQGNMYVAIVFPMSNIWFLAPSLFNEIESMKTETIVVLPRIQDIGKRNYIQTLDGGLESRLELMRVDFIRFDLFLRTVTKQKRTKWERPTVLF